MRKIITYIIYLVFFTIFIFAFYCEQYNRDSLILKKIIKIYSWIYNLFYSPNIVWIMESLMRVIIGIIILGFASMNSQLTNINPYLIGGVIGLWVSYPMFRKLKCTLDSINMREAIDVIYELESRVTALERRIKKASK